MSAASSTSAPASPSSEAPKHGFAADSLASGMLIMLMMTIVQRGLGFFRGLWFCGTLDDAVVGQWSMAYDFIIMMTPVMMLGIAGSLPRYTEHYRIRGHLKSFVKQLALSTAGLGVLAVTGMLVFPETLSWLIFLEPENTQLVYGLVVGVVLMLGYNFVYQLVSSLRQVRVASVMQFIQSIGFTGLAIAWLQQGGGVLSMIHSFALASGLAMVIGLRALRRGWSDEVIAEETFVSTQMWRRLIPYAAALWVMNLLTNTFTMSDRYMILHLMPGTEEATQSAVGQYHSGRILPMLMISVSSMVAGVLMPYLTADWEAGQKQLVRERLKQILFAVSTLFTAAAGVVILIAPWFFATVLENRYEVGLALLPMTFVFSIWICLGNIGQDYLWIVEKGKWVALAIGVGFAVNLVMNYFLLPVWGVHGAVLATLVSNGIVLLGFWCAMARFGYVWDQTTLAMTLLPLTLLGSPLIAIAMSLVMWLGLQQSRGWAIQGYAELKTRLSQMLSPSNASTC